MSVFILNNLKVSFFFKHIHKFYVILWVWGPGFVIALLFKNISFFFKATKAKSLIFVLKENSLFLKHKLFDFLKGSFFGFFDKLKLFGLDYKYYIWKVNVELRLDLTHLLFLYLPKNIKCSLSGRRKKKILFIGLCVLNLSNFVYSLYYTKPSDVYKNKGFCFLNYSPKKKKR